MSRQPSMVSLSFASRTSIGKSSKGKASRFPFRGTGSPVLRFSGWKFRKLLLYCASSGGLWRLRIVPAKAIGHEFVPPALTSFPGVVIAFVLKEEFIPGDTPRPKTQDQL